MKKNKSISCAISLLAREGIQYNPKDYNSILRGLAKYRGIGGSVTLQQGDNAVRIIRRWMKALANKDGTLKSKSVAPKRKPKATKKQEAFLTSWEWTTLRYKVLQHYGRKCMSCGATPVSGAVIQVDHILPRATHPQLALDFNNLQVLCMECNRGKGMWDTTDFRPRP